MLLSQSLILFKPSAERAYSTFFSLILSLLCSCFSEKAKEFFNEGMGLLYDYNSLTTKATASQCV
jgi:hypothetical protein